MCPSIAQPGIAAEAAKATLDVPGLSASPSMQSAARNSLITLSRISGKDQESNSDEGDR